MRIYIYIGALITRYTAFEFAMQGLISGGGTDNEFCQFSQRGADSGGADSGTLSLVGEDIIFKKRSKIEFK